MFFVLKHLREFAESYEAAIAADEIAAAFDDPAAALCIPDERRIPTQDEDAQQEAPQGFQMYAILGGDVVGEQVPVITGSPTLFSQRRFQGRAD